MNGMSLGLHFEKRVENFLVFFSKEGFLNAQNQFLNQIFLFPVD